MSPMLAVTAAGAFLSRTFWSWPGSSARTVKAPILVTSMATRTEKTHRIVHLHSVWASHLDPPSGITSERDKLGRQFFVTSPRISDRDGTHSASHERGGEVRAAP